LILRPLASKALVAGTSFLQAAQGGRTMASIDKSNPYLNENGKESPWKYPRPPDLQKTDRHLKVVYIDNGKEVILADTKNAYRVLETR
jgi:hypothetical protein